MTTQELYRKIQRIILDLEELSDERSLNSDAQDGVNSAIRILKDLNVYSTEV
jgi:hypothetical protein